MIYSILPCKTNYTDIIEEYINTRLRPLALRSTIEKTAGVLDPTHDASSLTIVLPPTREELITTNGSAARWLRSELVWLVKSLLCCNIIALLIPKELDRYCVVGSDVFFFFLFFFCKVGENMIIRIDAIVSKCFALFIKQIYCSNVEERMLKCCSELEPHVSIGDR